jgi:hypothetical protein
MTQTAVHSGVKVNIGGGWLYGKLAVLPNLVALADETPTSWKTRRGPIAQPPPPIVIVNTK